MKITLLLVAINIAVFLYTLQNPAYFIQTYGFSSDSFAKGNYISLVTAMFMHQGLAHIAVNMLILFFIGMEVEKEVGGFFYLLVYFLSGLVANLGVLLLPLIGQSATVVGASAAISGIIGYGAFRLSDEWVISPLRFIPLPMPFIIAGAVYFAMNFAGVVVFSLPAWGHVVGGITGALFGLEGEEHKLRKIILFSLLVVFISLLPYLFTYAVSLWR